jgi:thioredoxin 1
MMSLLTATNIDQHIRQPGVAIVNWRHPRSARSRAFDRELASAIRTHPDVRVGGVSITDDADLAREYEVKSIPTLMVYRDGILVYSLPGALSATLLEELIEAVFSLDMEEVRSGLNGHSGRIALVVQPDPGSPFSDGNGGTNGAAGNGGTKGPGTPRRR